MAFLSLQGLVKQYGSSTAVGGLSLNIEKGEFISLLGPSGCGKTTTLQMIAGFVEPTAGHVVLNGNDITSLKPNKRGLGMVFQAYALFPHMTVEGNVAFGLEMRKVSGEEQKRRVAEAIELVHLTPYAKRFPKELSGGQRQRVALARALVIRPDVLLLDEPLSNLDAKLREGMQLELRSIQRDLGITTIMVTHDQAEALAMSDRIAVMNGGTLVQVGKPYHAYENPEDAFVSNFLGHTNLLPGRVVDRSGENTTVAVADGTLVLKTGDRQVDGEVTLSVRPEKLRFCTPEEARLNGTVHARVFMGMHWHYEVETRVGRVTMIVPNHGGPFANEGDQVHIAWYYGELKILETASLSGDRANG